MSPKDKIIIITIDDDNDDMFKRANCHRYGHSHGELVTFFVSESSF